MKKAKGTIKSLINAVSLLVMAGITINCSGFEGQDGRAFNSSSSQVSSLGSLTIDPGYYVAWDHNLGRPIIHVRSFDTGLFCVVSEAEAAENEARVLNLTDDLSDSEIDAHQTFGSYGFTSNGRTNCSLAENGEPEPDSDQTNDNPVEAVIPTSRLFPGFVYVVINPNSNGPRTFEYVFVGDGGLFCLVEPDLGAVHLDGRDSGFDSDEWKAALHIREYAYPENWSSELGGFRNDCNNVPRYVDSQILDNQQGGQEEQSQQPVQSEPAPSPAPQQPAAQQPAPSPSDVTLLSLANTKIRVGEGVFWVYPEGTSCLYRNSNEPVTDPDLSVPASVQSAVVMNQGSNYCEGGAIPQLNNGSVSTNHSLRSLVNKKVKVGSELYYIFDNGATCLYPEGETGFNEEVVGQDSLADQIRENKSGNLCGQ